jgi:hypothetical protein
MVRHAAFLLCCCCALLPLAGRAFPDALLERVPAACSTAGDAAALGIAGMVLAVAHGSARRRQREQR